MWPRLQWTFLQREMFILYYLYIICYCRQVVGKSSTEKCLGLQDSSKIPRWLTPWAKD
jgi:hypothetical protein